MRTPLAYNDASNRCTTYRAGLPGTLVNPEMVLKISPAINPVDAGAVAGDPGLQHLTDSSPELPGLLKIQAARGAVGMQPCQVKGFIRVNIPQASQKGLIQ